jgi:hypothetical protein
MRGRDCLVEVAALAGDPRELEPAPDHVAVDGGEEPVRHLRARGAVVEDVDGVQGHGRVEEPAADCGVAGRGRGEVRGLAGLPIEEDRRLDPVRVGLERLQMVVRPAGCW